MRIGIFGKKYQKKEQIKKVFDILYQNHVEIFIQKEFYEYLKPDLDLKDYIAGIIDYNNLNLDMAFSIGGDGTFLRTVSAIREKNIPILGINTGRLGFLADVSEKDMEQTLSEILRGNYTIEKRSQLKLIVKGSPSPTKDYALNEIAILKQDSSSMITIDVNINGERLTSYEADGLLVSTPTGSTAYSLSVGGPIMAPNTSNFIITAIAPHSLSARPLVIEDNNILTLHVRGRSSCFLISLDGRSKAMPINGTTLQIEKASTSVLVVKRTGQTFYSTLKNKLKWGTDPRVD